MLYSTQRSSTQHSLDLIYKETLSKNNIAKKKAFQQQKQTIIQSITKNIYSPIDIQS
jgi:hypothetical protein